MKHFTPNFVAFGTVPLWPKVHVKEPFGEIAMRAGRFVRQLEGYRAFIPAPLPPQPPLTMDAELLGVLSKADRAPGSAGWGHVGPAEPQLVPGHVRASIAPWPTPSSRPSTRSSTATAAWDGS